ncbi:MAG: NUDIX hydrolase [Phycisphaerae bacterium]
MSRAGARVAGGTGAGAGRAGRRPALRRRGSIGVLTRGDRYLMIRRAAGLVNGGCWCFPGGHIEPGETSRAAVVRELAEELGLIVVPVARLGLVRVVDSGYVLAVWHVRRVRGALRAVPAEIAATAWMTLEEIGGASPGLPSNARVVDMLLHSG